MLPYQRSRVHHLVFAIVFILAGTSLTNIAVATDDKALEAAIKQGRNKAQICTRCHGRNGMTVFAQREGWENSISTYVIKQLLLFRGKRRKHVIMNAIAGPLTDLDISEIALWYESVSTSATNPTK